jgi:hypothetical protein
LVAIVSLIYAVPLAGLLLSGLAFPLVPELPLGNAVRETPVSRPPTILRISAACPGTPSLEAPPRAISLSIPRSRCRIGESEYPYFLTGTVVGWLPVFTRPEAVQIVVLQTLVE